MDRADAAYQLQVIARVCANVRHDVTVGHPLGDHRESPNFKGVRNPNEAENVGMGQIFPRDNLFAEPLHSV